jgi:hypothetical protein
MGSQHYKGKSGAKGPGNTENLHLKNMENQKNSDSHSDDTFRDPTNGERSNGSQNAHSLHVRTNATVESDIQACIDQELKNLYEDILNEEVPERFQLLLDMLDGKKEKGS